MTVSYHYKQLGSLLGQRSKSTVHWLPIKQRIQYKLLLLAYRVIHGHGPSNLNKLLKPHEPSRQLRSADKNILVVLFHVYGMLCLTQCVKSLQNTLLKNVWRRCFLSKPTTCSSIGFLCSTASTFKKTFNPTLTHRFYFSHKNVYFIFLFIYILNEPLFFVLRLRIISKIKFMAH